MKKIFLVALTLSYSSTAFAVLCDSAHTQAQLKDWAKAWKDELTTVLPIEVESQRYPYSSHGIYESSFLVNFCDGTETDHRCDGTLGSFVDPSFKTDGNQNIVSGTMELKRSCDARLESIRPAESCDCTLEISLLPGYSISLDPLMNPQTHQMDLNVLYLSFSGRPLMGPSQYRMHCQGSMHARNGAQLCRDWISEQGFHPVADAILLNCNRGSNDLLNFTSYDQAHQLLAPTLATFVQSQNRAHEICD